MSKFGIYYQWGLVWLYTENFICFPVWLCYVCYAVLNNRNWTVNSAVSVNFVAHSVIFYFVLGTRRLLIPFQANGLVLSEKQQVGWETNTQIYLIPILDFASRGVCTNALGSQYFEVKSEREREMGRGRERWCGNYI